MSTHSGDSFTQRSVKGQRHLLLRTLKNIRRNVVFCTLYGWCTIVFLRALTGAGYQEGLDTPSHAGLLARFESKDWARRAKEIAGSRLEALWPREHHHHHHHHRVYYPFREIAPDDVLGRLIFGAPDSFRAAEGGDWVGRAAADDDEGGSSGGSGPVVRGQAAPADVDVDVDVISQGGWDAADGQANMDAVGRSGGEAGRQPHMDPFRRVGRDAEGQAVDGRY